ncbi:MAG: hypothetical protein Q4B22_06385 [Eubacteriales bacterium]|nr:hypothetical protein [Eubacteriales bacterium]
MNTVVQFLIQWCGVILAAILGIIGICSASAKGLTRAEKDMKIDEEHYLVRHTKGGLFGVLLLWIAGGAVSFAVGWIGRSAEGSMALIYVGVEAAVVLLTSIIFIITAARITGSRVWVNGEEIIVYSAFSKMQITKFSDIRTVKKVGGETAAASRELVIRPNGGKRFKVDARMTNFALFARQLDGKVALPNLTKKRKKAEEKPEEKDA